MKTKNFTRLLLVLSNGRRIVSIIISLILLVLVVGASPGITEPELLSDDQIPDAAKYESRIGQEKEAVPLTKVEVINDRPLKALAYVTIGEYPKRAAIVLTGYGAFQWIRTAESLEKETGMKLSADVVSKMPPPKDPLFQMTMSTKEEWHIIKGITTGSQKQGSWVFIYPESGPWMEELALPLTELGVTADGKIAVMKFSNPSRTLVFYVPGRTQ